MAIGLYLTDQKKETNETKNRNLEPQGPWQTKAVHLSTKPAPEHSIKKKVKDATSSNRFEKWFNGCFRAFENLASTGRLAICLKPACGRLCSS
jgi:hypothetical protein